MITVVSLGNIAPEDIREAYRITHGLTSTAAITTHFIGAYAGNNGTFTVNANDRVGDRHGGHPDVENLASNLTAPKDIEVALPQTYEAQPGTALARFMVTRLRKTDGSWKVKKAHVPEKRAVLAHQLGTGRQRPAGNSGGDPWRTGPARSSPPA
jgi:hypothetical protein